MWSSPRFACSSQVPIFTHYLCTDSGVRLNQPRHTHKVKVEVMGCKGRQSRPCAHVCPQLKPGKHAPRGSRPDPGPGAESLQGHSQQAPRPRGQGPHMPPGIAGAGSGPPPTEMALHGRCTAMLLAHQIRLEPCAPLPNACPVLLPKPDLVFRHNGRKAPGSPPLPVASLGPEGGTGGRGWVALQNPDYLGENQQK